MESAYYILYRDWFDGWRIKVIALYGLVYKRGDQIVQVDKGNNDVTKRILNTYYLRDQDET